jgi:hypothetical protein
VAARDRQRRKIRVVAAVGNERVPFPDGDGSRDRHREDDEEIFVGQGRGVGVEFRLTAKPAEQRAVLLHHEDGGEGARHGEQRQHRPDAEVEVTGTRIITTVKNPIDAMPNEAPQRFLGRSLFVPSHGSSL